MKDKKESTMVPVIEARKAKHDEINLDEKGFFVIELVKDQIQVEYYQNVIKNHRIVSGKLKKIFVGTSAAALCDTIASYVQGLQSDHLLYLGREIMRAEYALKQDESYEQGGC